MEKETKLTFGVQHGLTEEDVLDVLTTAIEGGIGYWCCLDNTDPDWIEAGKQWKEEHNDIPCYCDTAYQVMKNGKAFKLIDEEDETVYEITLEKFLQGCAKFTQELGKDIHRSIQNSDFDAEDADMIIQYAAMGEVIYG